MDIQALAIECLGDTLIRTGPGLVYAIHLSLVDVEVGDTIVLRDAVAAGAGTVLFTFVANDEDQSYQFCPCIPFHCETGIYLDVTLTGGGTANVTVIYS